MFQSLNKNTVLTESGPSYIYLGNYAIQHIMQLYIHQNFHFHVCMQVYMWSINIAVFVFIYKYKIWPYNVGKGWRMAGREGEGEKMGEKGDLGELVLHTTIHIHVCIA